MSLSLTRIFLLLLALGALVFLGIFVFAVDPEMLNLTGQVAFFSLWFIFMGSSVVWVLLSLSVRFLGEERTMLYRGAAFRQGILFSLLLTACMLLQYLRLLTWWGAALLICFMLLIEFTYRRLSFYKR